MLLWMPLVLPLLLSRRFVECEERKGEIEFYAGIHTYFITVPECTCHLIFKYTPNSGDNMTYCGCID